VSFGLGALLKGTTVDMVEDSAGATALNVDGSLNLKWAHQLGLRGFWEGRSKAGVFGEVERLGVGTVKHRSKRRAYVNAMHDHAIRLAQCLLVRGGGHATRQIKRLHKACT